MQFKQRIFLINGKRSNPLFAVFLFLLVAGCGGGNSPVSGQGSGTSAEAFIKASIFSSVPQGGGSVPCSITCEFSYTAGANGVIKAQGTFSAMTFKCDTNGVPESGQGIDTQFTFDPNDAEVLEGGTVEVSCGPTGASIIDNLTFNFFNDSVDFIAQECINADHCTLTLELTSLKDQLNQSGLLDLLSKLSCPSLDLADKLFCSDTTSASATSQPADAGLFCQAIEAVRVSSGCMSSPGNTCGNNQLDEGEMCDGTIVKNCPPGATCIPAGQPNQCSCQTSGGNQCGNGIVDQGEACDGQAGICPPGTACGAPGDNGQCTCVPQAICSCLDVRCPTGQECSANNNCICVPVCTPTGPSETNCTDHVDNDCDTFIDCDDSDCIRDPACAPVCAPTGPTETNCTDNADDDCDGSIDCADSDCSGDPACAAPPPPACVATGPETGNCSDKVDNDCDGFTDCLDTDCLGDPACPSPAPPPR